MENLIYTSFDNNYEQYARMMLNSLDENYPNHPLVIIGHHNVTDNFKEFAAKLNNVQMMEIKEDELATYENMGVIGNPMVYDRLRCWSDEFDTFDKILFVDPDVLILKPLDCLFEREDFFVVDNNLDYPGTTFKNIDANLMKMLLDDGIHYNASYGNAACGLFVIQRKYRTPEFYSSMLDITVRYNDYLAYADQSALNIWLQKHKIKISNELYLHTQVHHLNFPNGPKLSDVHVLHFNWKKPFTLDFFLSSDYINSDKIYDMLMEYDYDR